MRRVKRRYPMKFKPGDRVCSIADFDYGTVVGPYPGHEDEFCKIILDHPDIDGKRLVAARWEDLVPEKPKKESA
jgi:hypothetical protein